MEEGFVPDLTHHNRSMVSHWVEGRPEKSFWTGLKVKDRQQHPITAYRCPRCGLLQNYALE